MRGTYQGVECRTGEVRLDGKMEKALIYVDRPGENDEQALAAAGMRCGIYSSVHIGGGVLFYDTKDNRVQKRAGISELSV